jgi:hypothetical protein
MKSHFRSWHLADMGNLPDVRFAKRRHSATASFDHIVAAGQEYRRDVDGKRPRGLEVAGKLELRVLIGPRRTAAMLLAVRSFSSANAERRVLAELSSCLPVRQHPGANLGFQHLADLGARKVFPDFNLLGCFDAPDPLLHEGR